MCKSESLNIICLVIMQKRFIKEKNEFPNSSRPLPLKQRLWLALPYPVRLRIEHKCWLSTVILKHYNQYKRTLINRIRVSVARKLAPLYQEILKLNNPYLHGIQKMQEDMYKDSERMRNFLIRVNSTNHFKS